MLTIDLLGLSRSGFRALPHPSVVCLTSFRYDAHLVPDMKRNLAGVVDGFVLWDDRQAAQKYSSEPERRARLLAAARDLGANWVLGVDPDERFEPAMAARIRDLTAGPDRIWTFDLRELWSPTSWRSDGIWAKKAVARLWPLHPELEHRFQPLHSSWAPQDSGLPRKMAGIALYHLKTIDARRREKRSALYAALDPERKFSGRGYDYLKDETGLELTEIPPERMYQPAHVDDGGLWMPDYDATVIDPPDLIIMRAIEYGADGFGQAGLDLLDQARLVWRSAADLGQMARALLVLSTAPKALESLDAADPDQAPVEDLVLAIETCHATGDTDGRDRRLARARALHPSDPALELASIRHGPRLPDLTTDVFQRLGWAPCPVRVRAADQPRPAAAMGTVVLCVGAAPEVRDAVASLVDQAPATSIIVVNSGGGDLGAALGDLAPRTTRIELAKRVYAGAARNIGAALVTEPHLAFLASDCLAAPDWVNVRLAHHADRPVAVASALLPHPVNNVVAVAHHLSMHPARIPEAADRSPLTYGVSIPTVFFYVVGPYETGLGGGEDTVQNARLARWIPLHFAPDLITFHRGPTRLPAALADLARRGAAEARLVPLIADHPLRAWNTGLLRWLVGQPASLLRVRARFIRGKLPAAVSWTDSQTYHAARRALWLLILARIAGRLSVLPSGLWARIRAFWALRAFSKGGPAATLVGSIGNGRFLDATVIRQIEAALRDAGQATDADALVARVTRENPLLKIRR